LNLNFQLEAEGFNLKATESLLSFTSAAGNSGFHFQQPPQTNPIDYQQPEPFLQIG